MSRNAEPPIVVTELGMVTEVSWLLEKAEEPMVVTSTPLIVLGIVTDLLRQAEPPSLAVVKSAWSHLVMVPLPALNSKQASVLGDELV